MKVRFVGVKVRLFESSVVEPIKLPFGYVMFIVFMCRLISSALQFIFRLLEPNSNVVVFNVMFASGIVVSTMNVLFVDANAELFAWS